jgi:predicted MPP superfamily phosphohydrolase
MGLSILLFFWLLASEIVRAVANTALRLSSRPVDVERRTFVSRVIAGTVSVLSLGLAGVGVASALGKVALARVRVPLRRLPLPMSGFRIVQVSDLHIGATLGGEWLARIVEEVNAADPDVVVITGDLVDGSVAQLRAEVAPLADLRARHGVYFVTGNHEYYSGVDAWLEELRRLGIRPLCNERVSIGDGDQSFDLAGVHDWGARRLRHRHQPDLARALEGRDPSRELVLLAHQPKQIHEAERLGVGLQLSGHTHGGQIFPWGLFVRLDQPYVAGLSQHGSAHIYVSRGTGFWGPPMRVAAPPEISVLELVTA